MGSDFIQSVVFSLLLISNNVVFQLPGNPVKMLYRKDVTKALPEKGTIANWNFASG